MNQKQDFGNGCRNNKKDVCRKKQDAFGKNFPCDSLIKNILQKFFPKVGK